MADANKLRAADGFLALLGLLVDHEERTSGVGDTGHPPHPGDVEGGDRVLSTQLHSLGG